MEAIEAMLACLGGARLRGLPTTVDLHRNILQDASFRAGDFDTSWLENFLECDTHGIRS